MSIADLSNCCIFSRRLRTCASYVLRSSSSSFSRSCCLLVWTSKASAAFIKPAIYLSFSLPSSLRDSISFLVLVSSCFVLFSRYLSSFSRSADDFLRLSCSTTNDSYVCYSLLYSVRSVFASLISLFACSLRLNRARLTLLYFLVCSLA